VRTQFSGTGADLAWRVKNGAKSLPARTLEVLPGGSGLVILHESAGMRARRRKEAPWSCPGFLPGTMARLITVTVTVTVTAVTISGRRKTTRIRRPRLRGIPGSQGHRPGDLTH
jgi:hypothetical protein